MLEAEHSTKQNIVHVDTCIYTNMYMTEAKLSISPKHVYIHTIILLVLSLALLGDEAVEKYNVQIHVLMA